VKVIPKRRVLRELAEGFKDLWASRLLRLYLLLSTFSVMISDALVFTSLQRYLQAGAGRAGAFGLYLAASALGLALSSAYMMLRRPRAKDGSASDPLERQGKWSSIMHGLGWLCYWGVFFLPLWSSLGAMLASAALSGPFLVIWASLTQREAARRFPESMGKVYSAILVYQVAVSIVGLLLLGWLATALSTAALLLVTGGLVTLAAAFDFIQPFLIFPRKRAEDQRPKA
jgi:hypothetical protein